MRKFYLSLSLLFVTALCYAQKNGSIRGIAFDTISKQPVAAATVTLLEKKDSSLVSFTMTDNAGRFELTGIPNGEYRLMISHVNYHNTDVLFTISDENKKQDLANIIMNDKNKVLAEVIVSNEAPPVTMVGDTVQYNAGSFKVQPNASVEQLLKKLPGVKVEKDGTVKAQGEKVSRVLVDGKEFFGDDPKIATKNLPADAVDKVQVYDKQSDQAQLTGFEDGNYEKTINLKLKKDKKKGVFGKVAAGAGNKERYEGKFNVNSFKGARQMSAIGMGNNTNAEGFSFMDILNFTGELARMQRGAGGGGNININISGDDAAAMGMNSSQNGGINTAWGGGLNYNNIIGNKLDFQSNYFYNRFNPDVERHTNRQNITPGGINSFYDQNSFTNNLSNSHRLNLNGLYQIDSMHSLRIIPSLSYQKTRNNSLSDFRTRSGAGSMINEGGSGNLTSSEGFTFRNDFIFRKKFNRRGRTFSLTLQTSLNESEGDRELNSITNFYTSAGSITGRDTINQQSNNNGSLKSYSTRAIYTEPVFKRSLLEFSMGKSSSTNKSALTTWDYNKQSQKYDMLNDLQTNDYENKYGFTNAGIRIRTQKKKYSYSVGLAWQQAELEGKIISGVKDSVISQTFRNLLPNARFQYNFSRFKSLSINYSASTNQPGISQLQPVPDLSNRLNIRQGNPDLKQEYNHVAQGHLNLISPYKNKNLFMFFTLQGTRNKIVSYDSLDLQTGVRYTKPVNVNGVYNINSNISYSMPVRFLKGTIEISGRTGYQKTKQFINSFKNDIRTLTLGPEIRLDMNATEKLNVSLDANVNYNKTKYSLQSSSNNKYLSQEYSTSFDWQLPKQFFLSTDFTYTINSHRSAGFNTKIPIWNAAISKQFLRYNRGELKFSAYDLLNKNVRVSRSSTQNYIEDVRVNTLRRFCMLTFTYSLSKTGLNNAGNGGVRIISR